MPRGVTIAVAVGVVVAVVVVGRVIVVVVVAAAAVVVVWLLLLGLFVVVVGCGGWCRCCWCRSTRDRERSTWHVLKLERCASQSWKAAGVTREGQLSTRPVLEGQV